jgi:WD40 repeat protein
MGRKRTTFFVLIAVLIGIIFGILIWRVLSPKLGEGAFYYRLENYKANLFLLNGKGEGEKIVTVPAQEVDLGKYKPPKISFLSPDRKYLIYFKKIKEEIIGDIENNLVVAHNFYQPILITLKTGKETEINQQIDASGLVFSPDSKQIAWIKEIKESTLEEIEKNQVKRELWISRIDGENAQLIVGFNEKVVLLKTWNNDNIYFQGIYGVNYSSLGRINVVTKKIERILPEKCDKELSNCQNIAFSPTGRLFLYEIYTKTEKREVTELYLGDFDARKYKPVLTTDRISDKLWLSNEKGFFYTEQEMTRDRGVRETIHLVDLYKETEQKLYQGSYISQLVCNSANDYLYFLENENGDEVNRFKLMQLNIKTKKADTILVENYNNILLIQ